MKKINTVNKIYSFFKNNSSQREKSFLLRHLCFALFFLVGIGNVVGQTLVASQDFSSSTGFSTTKTYCNDTSCGTSDNTFGFYSGSTVCASGFTATTFYLRDINSCGSSTSATLTLPGMAIGANSAELLFEGLFGFDNAGINYSGTNTITIQYSFGGAYTPAITFTTTGSGTMSYSGLAGAGSVTPDVANQLSFSLGSGHQGQTLTFQVVVNGFDGGTENFFLDEFNVFANCGLTLGDATVECTDGDTYQITVPYTGVESASVTANNTGNSGTLSFDPTIVDGDLTITGISDLDNWSFELMGGACMTTKSGTAPRCEECPVTPTPPSGITITTCLTAADEAAQNAAADADPSLATAYGTWSAAVNRAVSEQAMGNGVLDITFEEGNYTDPGGVFRPLSAIIPATLAGINIYGNGSVLTSPAGALNQGFARVEADNVTFWDLTLVDFDNTAGGIGDITDVQNNVWNNCNFFHSDISSEAFAIANSTNTPTSVRFNCCLFANNDDGNADRSAMSITGDDNLIVDFVNTDFICNKRAGDGGAVKISPPGAANSGPIVFFQGGTFTGNETTLTAGDAGAIYMSEGTLTIDGTQFINNTSIVNSGEDGGGAIRVLSGSLSVYNATFSGNSATANNGGAICVSGSGSIPVIINNCTFIGNTASADGGAIFTGDQENLQVINSTFDSNTSGGQGAAMYVKSGSGNTPRNKTVFYMSGTTISNNVGGDGLYIWNAETSPESGVVGGDEVTITNSTMCSNTGTYDYNIFQDNAGGLPPTYISFETTEFVGTNIIGNGRATGHLDIDYSMGSCLSITPITPLVAAACPPAPVATANCAPPVCEANAGTLPTDPLGCQEVTDMVGGTSTIQLSSYLYNNTTAYTQVFFITDGTNVLETISVVGTGTTPVAAVSTGMYAEGTYTVYAINYQTSDANAATTVAGLTILPTTVADITTVSTTVATDCIVRADNPMIVEICDPECGCDDAATVGVGEGTLETLTNVPGSYNTIGHAQTYLLTNNTGLIIDIQESATFTGLEAGTYNVYAINYNTTASENPFLTIPITANVTNIAALTVGTSISPCYELSTASNPLTVAACPIAMITETDASETADDSIVCAGDAFTLTASGGDTYAWSVPAGSALTSTTSTLTATMATLADAGTYTVTVTDAAGCTATTTLDMVVNSCVACAADAGAVTDPMGCQEITDMVGGTSTIDLLSYGFNNTMDYTQAYFITDGTAILELVEVAGNGTVVPTTATSTSLYAAGTYAVYTINYQTSDGTVPDFSTYSTVAEITGLGLGTTWTAGPCMVIAENGPMMVNVCDPIDPCTTATPITLQGITAVPGSYNPTYGQTYLLANSAGLIIDMQESANFDGLTAGMYMVYALNYSSTTDSPLADGATWIAITLNITTIADLAVTPGLADACFELSAGAPYTLEACGCLDCFSDDCDAVITTPDIWETVTTPTSYDGEATFATDCNTVGSTNSETACYEFVVTAADLPYTFTTDAVYTTSGTCDGLMETHTITTENADGVTCDIVAPTTDNTGNDIWTITTAGTYTYCVAVTDANAACAIDEICPAIITICGDCLTATCNNAPQPGYDEFDPTTTSTSSLQADGACNIIAPALTTTGDAITICTEYTPTTTGLAAIGAAGTAACNLSASDFTTVVSTDDGTTCTDETAAGTDNGYPTYNLTGGMTYNICVTVTLPADCTLDELCIAPYGFASIAGNVFEDGAYDGLSTGTDDSPIENVIVTLYTSGGTQVGSPTMTDNMGDYEFTNVPDGDYYVTFTTPSGYGITPQDDTTVETDVDDSDISATDPFATTSNTPPFTVSSMDITGVDAGYVALGSIEGTFFTDTNGNGMDDAAEPNVTGETITLTYCGADGDCTTTGDNATFTTTTDGTSGDYVFENLLPGNYEVDFPLPADNKYTTQGTPTTDVEDADDSDVDTTDGTVAVILDTPANSGDAGDMVVNIDAGIFNPIDIMGTVFVDADNNGMDDDGATPATNVTVTLMDANTNMPVTGFTPVMTTGGYTFTDVPPGDYYVTFTTPTGYTTTTPGTNSSTITDLTDVDDSDINASGQTPTFTVNSGDDDMDNVDAGFIGIASIGDTVYEDTNGNGTQDTGEPGITGVTVTATWYGPDGTLGGGDDVVYTDVTDGSGMYDITDLPPGDYDISVTSGAPTNSTATENTGGITSETIAAGEDYNDGDFGYEPNTATIGDFVFVDLDNDGIYNNNDVPLAGVTVTLYDAGTDAAIPAYSGANAATTDANGAYSFTSVPAGNYYVVFTTPTGYAVSTAGSGDNQNNITGTTGAGSTADFTFDGTANNTTIDAGFIGTASIGDTVYEDTNGNDTQDVGEPGISGVTVTATWYGPDGMLGGGDDVVYTDVTDGSGMYDITDLPPGDYDISVTSGAPTNSTATENTGGITSETIAAGEDYNAADFGYEPNTATIGDFVFVDLDNDGIYNNNDVPLAGVTVTLYDAGTDAAIPAYSGANAATTDANGAYSFTSVPAGNYYVVFTTPTGYAVSTAGSGDNQNNITGTTGAGSTADFTFDGTANNTTIDAGFIGTASIGDTVYEDTNGNDTQDVGEPGISGVTVTATWYGPDGMLGGGDDVVYTDVTDGSGMYDITDLPPGDYDISVTSGAPTNSTATENTGGITSETIAAGEDYNDGDFGYEPNTAAIGDFVFVDLDNDGIYNNNDVPLAGVTVTLYDAGTDAAIPAYSGANAATTDANGAYSFTSVPAGNYYVVFTTPTGYAVSTAGTGDNQNNITGTTGAGSTADFTFDGTANNTTIDAGFIGTASIGDTVYEDTNGNDTQDVGEPGISGVTVTATWYGPDGMLGGGDDVVYTDVTDGSGMYDITDLPPGDYDISVTSGAPTNSTATENTGGITSETIAAGEDYNDGDFGYEPNTAAIGDFVFVDLDNDGIYNNNDVPLAGVTVTLYDATTDTATSFTDVTDASGAYSLDNVPTGNYYVVFTTPTGYAVSTAGSGDNQNNITGTTGAGSTADFTFDGLANNTTIDAGFICTDTDGDLICDIIDIDDDNDGILDVVELGCAEGSVFGSTCPIADPAGDDDGDGTPNYADPDVCTLVNGVCPDYDHDGDGVPNHLDLDADNDGIPDIIEAGGFDGDNDGQVDYPTAGDPTSMTDADNDGLSDDPIIDSNDDGIADTPADPNTNDTSTQSNLDPINTDSGQGPDYLDLDADDDGIPDTVEAGGTDDDNDGYVDNYDPTTGTWTGTSNSDNDGWDNAIDGDTDNNGTIDNTGNELITDCNTCGDDDPDGDNMPNHLDLDSDGDGCFDTVEADVADNDTDDDGIVGTTGLIIVDADGDGWSDITDSDNGGTVLTNTDPATDMYTDASNQPIWCGGVCLLPKAWLQGAIINVSGSISQYNADNLMRDDLRAGGYLPTTEPYTTDFGKTLLLGSGRNIASSVFAVTGANAIVDWVIVELRSAADPTIIVSSQPVLIQRDGDIVHVDGVSPVVFTDVVDGSYYVRVDHRNHMGTMTANPIPLSNTCTVVDFRTMTSAELWDDGTIYDGFEQTTLGGGGVLGGQRALYLGDANYDGQIKYDGSSNDPIIVAIDVLLHPNNTSGEGTFDFAFGYYQGDVNMNGKVKYESPDDDQSLILLQVLLYQPLNSVYISNYDFLLEQTP